MYKFVKLSDRTTPQWSQWYVVQTCCDRIPCCWERISVKHPHTSLQCLWKCCGHQKHQWSTGEELKCFRNRKNRAPWFASGHPATTTVSPEMLKHAEAIVCKDQHITTQQLVLSLTISKERATSSETLDIQKGTRYGFLKASQLNTELRERLKDRPSYTTLSKQMKPRPSILNWRKKGNPRNGTILSLSRIKNSKSPHQWV